MKAEVDLGAHPECRIGMAPPRTRVWRDGRLVAEGFPVAEVSDQLARPGAVVWLDLCGPVHDELGVISEELGLDRLAVEDAVSEHERSKLDHYAGYMFLNVYAAQVTDRALALCEVSAFITERALVTVRQDEGFDIDAVIARWDGDPELLEHGVPALLYGLLDLIADGHFAALQALDNEAEELEDLMFGEALPGRQLQRRSFDLRKSLVHLRKVVLPTREIAGTLLHRDQRLIPAPLVPYYQDVYDHTQRAVEWTESMREQIANLLDTRLALQGNRLNEVMKKLTSWGAIIAVPTAVTGYYGQNVPYPGSQQHGGFVVSTLIIVLTSVGLYALFKKNDWL